MSEKRHFNESESDEDDFSNHIPTAKKIDRQFSEVDNFLIVETQPISAELNALDSREDDEHIIDGNLF